MQAATIKIFLVHGKPNGLRIAELSNWSGKAIAAPRTELAELLKRDELANPGIYFLTGVDPESGDRAIYIGEAENVVKRLRSHSSKDFWNAVTVFVSKDENLTKAHIRYLEGKLIRIAEGIDNFISVNSVNSGSRLPESDEAEMDVFLQKCMQLLPVLGVSDFIEKAQSRKNDKDLLYCKIHDLIATGKRTADGFIVFKDSQAVLEHRASATRVKIKREELVAKGHLKQVGDHLVFTRDLEFGSPSAAGSIIRGGHTNGLTNWRNKAGKQLKEIEAGN